RLRVRARRAVPRGHDVALRIGSERGAADPLLGRRADDERPVANAAVAGEPGHEDLERLVRHPCRGITVFPDGEPRIDPGARLRELARLAHRAVIGLENAIAPGRLVGRVPGCDGAAAPAAVEPPAVDRAEGDGNGGRQAFAVRVAMDETQLAKP